MSKFNKLFRFHPFTASKRGTTILSFDDSTTTTISNRNTALSSSSPQGLLKKEIKPTLYGKKCDAIIVDSHCGKYNFIEFKDATTKTKNLLLIKELLACAKGSRIPGRLLGKIVDKNGKNSYYVGVGGMVALLPSTAIPSMHHFSPRDISTRKAFWFYLLKVESPSTIHLSLLPPDA